MNTAIAGRPPCGMGGPSWAGRANELADDPQAAPGSKGPPRPCDLGGMAARPSGILRRHRPPHPLEQGLIVAEERLAGRSVNLSGHHATMSVEPLSATSTEPGPFRPRPSGRRTPRRPLSTGRTRRLRCVDCALAPTAVALPPPDDWPRRGGSRPPARCMAPCHPRDRPAARWGRAFEDGSSASPAGR